MNEYISYESRAKEELSAEDDTESDDSFVNDDEEEEVVVINKYTRVEKEELHELPQDYEDDDEFSDAEPKKKSKVLVRKSKQ